MTPDRAMQLLGEIVSADDVGDAPAGLSNEDVAACKLAAELLGREPLVQEVIQEFKHILCDYTRMSDLLNACRKLAEWKP